MLHGFFSKSQFLITGSRLWLNEKGDEVEVTIVAKDRGYNQNNDAIYMGPVVRYSRKGQEPKYKFIRFWGVINDDGSTSFIPY